MSAPAWCAPFIGAPYSDDGQEPGSFNCWTLFRAGLKAGFGLELEDYGGPVWSGRSNARALAEAAEAHAAQFRLLATGAQWRAGKRPEQPGDGILIRLSGEPVHVGLVVAKGSMLHIDRGIDACVERYDGPLWVHRLVGFYRVRPDDRA